MKTLLDDRGYTYWYTESANLGVNSFSITIRSGDSQPLKRVKVEFEHCVYASSFNEFARNRDDEVRSGQIIHQHDDSALLKWIEDYTIILMTEMKKEEAKHFSILLSDNIYHIVSGEPPIVSLIEEAEPCVPANPLQH